MTDRPERGTPEYDLWVAACVVAASFPRHNDDDLLPGHQWLAVERTRAALDRLGVSWRGTTR